VLADALFVEQDEARADGSGERDFVGAVVGIQHRVADGCHRRFVERLGKSRR
jgi:hypothetical protein